MIGIHWLETPASKVRSFSGNKTRQKAMYPAVWTQDRDHKGVRAATHIPRERQKIALGNSPNLLIDYHPNHNPMVPK